MRQLRARSGAGIAGKACRQGRELHAGVRAPIGLAGVALVSGLLVLVLGGCRGLGTWMPPAIGATATALPLQQATPGATEAAQPAPGPSPTGIPPTAMPTEAPSATPALAPVASADNLAESLRASFFGAAASRPLTGTNAAVFAIQLSTADDAQPLWAAYTSGARSLQPPRDNFVGVYAFADGWEELARLDLKCPDYLAEGQVRQVQVAGDRLWLELDGAAGAHSGCYDLVSFDGEQLRDEVTHANGFPGVGQLRDLDGDTIPEVVLDRSDAYVFCYACGVRFLQYDVLRWDGSKFVPVKLTNLPQTAAAGLRRINDRSVALAQAGLWKDAAETIAQVKGNQDPIVRWNATLIDLQAQARARDARSGPYRLLGNVFYGDYAGALGIVRNYGVAQIFGSETPLVVGTPAEGWEKELSSRIVENVTKALADQPGLATAYYLRGWATHLVDPGNPNVLADIRKAAQLMPGYTLFSGSVTYLTQHPRPTATRTPRATVAPTATRTPAATVTTAPPTPVRIEFPQGATTYTFTPVLTAGAPQSYVLKALAGQVVSITPSGGTGVDLLGPDGGPLHPASTEAGVAQYDIPQTADYTIVLRGSGQASVTIHIPPLSSAVVVTRPATPERISFTPGSSSATISTTLAADAAKGYVLRAAAGQTLSVFIDGNAELTVLDSAGNLATATNPGAGEWEVTAAETGDYTLILQGSGNVAMEITIPPPAGSTGAAVPTPAAAQRLMIPAGGTGVGFSTTLVAGRSKSYLLNVQAGQQILIDIDNPDATMLVLDPSSQVLVPESSSSIVGHTEYRAPAAGDYTILLQGAGVTGVLVEIPVSE